jgi:hypothetical protein
MTASENIRVTQQLANAAEAFVGRWRRFYPVTPSISFFMVIPCGGPIGLPFSRR